MESNPTLESPVDISSLASQPRITDELEEDKFEGFTIEDSSDSASSAANDLRAALEEES